MLGGVPEPRPELADLIVQMRPFRFFRQTMAWSLVKRRPWMQLALQSAALLLPAAILAQTAPQGKLASWLDCGFASRFELSRRQLGPMERYGFWLPSRQEAARVVVAMSRRMARATIYGSLMEEVRYPYLDQSLIELILSIPRTQIIRPGERRSLMRRALGGLVPDEILSRRTKGTTARRPILALTYDWKELDQLLHSSISGISGYVNQIRFREALIAAKSGRSLRFVPLLQTLSLEFWLEGIFSHHQVRTRLQTNLPQLSALRPAIAAEQSTGQTQKA
jgi:asparagine synthase (glutamine-hydrolysing)